MIDVLPGSDFVEAIAQRFWARRRLRRRLAQDLDPRLRFAEAASQLGFQLLSKEA